MTKKATDDLDAVRVLIETLEPFEGSDRERIMRWACEKLGMDDIAPVTTTTPTRVSVSSAEPPERARPQAATDIKTFVDKKNPRSDRQLAAVVAYYHQFEAPGKQQKDSIDSADIIEACRKAERTRPKTPGQTLINAFTFGLLDKTSERGRYHLNSVGENLVAMVLPETDAAAPRRTRRKTTRKAAKKTPRKKKTVKKKKKPTRKKKAR